MTSTRQAEELTSNTCLRRTEEWLSTELDGSVVMMHGSSGRFVGFNKTASRIWKLLETPLTLEQISIRLADEFEITPEQALTDMTPLVTLLLKNGAVSREDV